MLLRVFSRPKVIYNNHDSGHRVPWRISSDVSGAVAKVPNVAHVMPICPLSCLSQVDCDVRPSFDVSGTKTELPICFKIIVQSLNSVKEVVQKAEVSMGGSMIVPKITVFAGELAR